MKRQNIIKIAGICGVLLPIVLFLCISLAIGGSPWFSWADNALSDLGVNGISAFLFNNGIVIGGFLFLIFSIGLLKTIKQKTGAYLLIISSISLIGIGLFPKTLYVLHYISSSAFFIFITLALFIIGVTMIHNKFEDKLGLAALVFAIIACASPVFFLFLEGIAIPEAIACFPAFLWCMVYGFKLIKEKPAETFIKE